MNRINGRIAKYLFILLASAGVAACSNEPGTNPVGPTATPNAASVAGGSSASPQPIRKMDEDEPDEDNTIIITDFGVQPQNLKIEKPGVVTFINRSHTNRWMRSHPHMPGGHNTCPGSDGADVFELVGVLTPGQSGRTGVIIQQSCGFHDHLLKDPGIFQGTVTVEEGYRTALSALSAISLSPASVVGGNPSQGTATLTSAAPSGGAVVMLSSSNTAAATVPASVAIAAGSTSATFALTTAAVSASTPVTITGSYGGATRMATLTVTPRMATVTYINDAKPILDANCIVCHSGPNPAAGRNYTTYAGVMAVVTPFSASSPLIVQTQAGGGMASHLTAAQAEVLRQWVVVYGAPQQ